MNKRDSRRWRFRSSWFAIALLASACDGKRAAPSAPNDVVPLLGPDRPTTILTQEHRLAMPSGSGANRFLQGWWPIKTESGPRLVPWNGQASVELVRLREKRARLHLATEHSAGVKVLARLGTRALDVTSSAQSIVIELPSDVPVGRHTIDLSFAKHEPPVLVRGAVVRPRRSPGHAHFEEGDVCLEGDVLVEQIRADFGASTRLVGRFEGPKASPGRRFAIQIEGEDGESRSVFEWSGASSQRFDVGIGNHEGLVRIRFLGSGEGESGCWRGLSLRHAHTTPAARPEPKAIAPPAITRPKLVLLYVMDALRADFLGHIAAAQGLQATWPSPLSPNLDRLANEGMSFLSHYSVAPNTLPSTKALFIGRTFVDRGGWMLAAEAGPTLAEQMRSSGYRTAMFSANEYVGASFGTGRGFDFIDPETRFVFTGGDQINDTSARVNEAAIRWLEATDSETPAFLYLHSLNPHNPYQPPARWIDHFTQGLDSAISGDTATLLDVQKGRREVSVADQQRLRALYAASVAYNDSEIGKLLAYLTSRYHEQDMLLVFTSDHGEELFEHDGVLHGYTLHREMLHIPLVLWAPGRIPVGRSRTPTDTLDLFVSLLELAGAAVPTEAQGRSLLPLLGGEGLDENTRFASASSVEGGIFAAHTRNRKVVWAPRTGLGWGMGNGRGRGYDGEYVFDLQRDAHERSNLAGSGELAVEKLRSQLHEWVARGRSKSQTAEPPIDPETRKNLEALGYIDH